MLVGTEAPGVRRTYTYRIPPEHDVEGILDRGARVVVPFGRQPLLGTILDRSPDPPGDVDDERIRDILDRVRGDGDRVPASVMEMVEYLAEQSLSGLATALRCAVPEFQSARLVKGWRRVTECAPPTNAEALSGRFDAEETNVLDETEVRSTLGDAYEAVVRKARATGWLLPAYRVAGPRIRARWVRSLSLAQSWDTTLEAARAMEGRSPARARLLRHLVEIGGGPTPAADATRAASTTAATASALERDGWIRVESLRSLRAPGRTPGLPSAPPELNTDQQGAVDHIDSLLEARQARVVLLQGVTGSGKTEVYLRAIASNRRLRRTALVLVPEIALTAQVVDLFRARLGERVAVLHSGLSEGERRDEWFRIASGDADVVVGARSAVFAPLENLGLVVMDEEHEGSYKQDSPSPRYHARDIALERARRSGAVVVLGSATPSVETRWRSEQGDWERVVLPERANRLPMPEVRIVDLRAAWKAHGPCLLAPELAEALSGTLERGEQAILFLNRRGFAMFLLCRDCGYSTRCPRCEVSLTLHRSSDRLVCHHCDHEAPVPEVCPSCGGDRLRPFGIGTERVEAEIQGLFPSARPIRMDRDTTTHKDSHRQLLGAFRRGEANILIGTQMVAKGLDFPNFTLVGVVSADT
ncbi:MAG: primosomal protein N', partial [Armatimonadota bacterium]